MKNIFFILVLFIVITNFGLSQEIQNPKTQLIDRPIESKLNYSAWRTDYYICTGIAYAKSLGMTAKDFAVFVGSKHSITGPLDTSISAVINTFNTVMTTYPKGIVELRSETNSNATMIWNRPYMAYFKNGPVLGVTLDEFEEYLYGHVAIMTKRIGILFKYEIKGDTVFGNITRYR
jgi:hypothetical protein